MSLVAQSMPLYMQGGVDELICLLRFKDIM